MNEQLINQTTGESMDDYKEELNASFRKIREGDIITGTIIDVSDTEILVDLKYYTPGVILAEDYSDVPCVSLKSAVETGDTITATVIDTDDGNDRILLSCKDMVRKQSWEKLNELFEAQSVIHTTITGIVNGGVIVTVEGTRGFVPASRLSLSYVEDLNEWLHKEIDLRIITCDEQQQKLVLSAREILREKQAEEQGAAVRSMQPGTVMNGTVETLMPYGAFIRLENGISGLVHISEICEKRIKHPKVVLKEGEDVTVKIIDIKDGKLSLSMKALLDVTDHASEETVIIPESENISTSLGDLFANIKLP